MLWHILLIVTHQPARSMTYSNLLFLKVVSNHGVFPKSKIEEHTSHLKCYPVRALDWGTYN